MFDLLMLIVLLYLLAQLLFGIYILLGIYWGLKGGKTQKKNKVEPITTAYLCTRELISIGTMTLQIRKYAKINKANKMVVKNGHV